MTFHREDYDEQGLYSGAEHTMRTWKGARVNPLALWPEDVDIEDIAHALSLQCRYNGHTHGHLSVARHCLWVSRRLEDTSVGLELWGLLHDAGEAYLGDMIRPLKHTPEMAPFRKAEDAVDQAIAEAFNLAWPMPDAVKEADTYVCVEIEMAYQRDHYDGLARNDELEFVTRFDRLNKLEEQHA